jgi:hypothetical protein
VRYKLYLDDIRVPAHVGSGLKNTPGWLLARTYDEAVNIVIDKGCPVYISFDHHLGDATAKTGYDFAKWLVDQDLAYNIIPVDFEFNVHSSDPVGTANIINLLDAYLKTR